MMDQITDELRTRMDITAHTIHPTAHLVDGARRRYRQRRTVGAVLATGATVAVFAAAVTVPAALSHRSTGGSHVLVAEPPSAGQSAPEQTWTVTMSSGLTFTLPAGFRATHIGPVRTKLGPDEPDVNDLTGYSMVTSAESDTPGQEITLATYEGDVGADQNTKMSQPGNFGTDPARETMIEGHDAWISTVEDIPKSGCVIKKAGEPKNYKIVTGAACGT